MKNILLISSALLLSAIFFFQSCEKEENETKISSHNESESHHTGENCMNCHTSGGSGEGWFSIAGTVYDSLKTSTYPKGTVKLHTGSNGTGSLISTIEVDALGNFYSTEHIDFGNGLYTSVQGNLDTKHMHSMIITGQCNGCHGLSTIRIWTE